MNITLTENQPKKNQTPNQTKPKMIKSYGKILNAHIDMYDIKCAICQQLSYFLNIRIIKLYIANDILLSKTKFTTKIITNLDLKCIKSYVIRI